MEFATAADRAYANGAFIPGAEEYPPRWQAQAAAYRGALGAQAQVGLTYGPGDRHRFDLFLPAGTPRGLLVFVHGGYWMAFGRSDWSHLAAGAVTRGWACAMPSYAHAPGARIGAITELVAQAVSVAAGMVAGPVIMTGHSAGGHLAARMGCADTAQATGGRVQKVVPISPIADLAPLMDTSMNDCLRIDEPEVAAESPALLPLRPDCTAHVWVGGQERPAFLWQARTLSEAWSCNWTVAPGRHHFDVIDDLADPASALMAACLDGL